MRTLTAEQRAVLEAPNYATYARLEVADDFGNLQDLSPWLVSVAYGNRQDQPIPELRAQLVRDASDLDSTSPMIDPSRLDIGRHVRLSVATLPEGQPPTDTDYVPVFDGTLDQVQFASDPLTVIGRGTGHETGTQWIEEETTYGSEGGTPIHEVMQEILDDWAPAVILETPVVPAFNVLPYAQQPMSVQDALQQLAALIGWVVLTYWHDGSDSFRLYFVEPDRLKTAIDWTLGPQHYFDVDQLDLNVLDIRNVIQVKYSSNGTVGEVEAIDDESVQRYGRFWAEFVEGSDSPIDTEEEAQALADAALSDLGRPRAEQVITTKYGWHFEINDLIRFLPNGSHYVDAQDWAALGLWHELTPTTDITRITVRGKPAGNYAAWRGKEDPGGEPGQDLPQPFGVVSPRIEPDGSLWFDAHGNDVARSFRWNASLQQLPDFPDTLVDAPEGVDIDTGITVPQGSTTWVACWWYNRPGGTGIQGRRVGQSVTRPLDPEGTQTPYFEALRTQHADVNHVDLSGRVTDPMGVEGGRLSIRVNKFSVESPNPTATADDVLPITATGTSFAFGPDTVFPEAGNRLQNVLYQPGSLKTVYYHYVSASGLSTGVFAYQIDSHLPIIDPEGELKDLTVDTRHLFNEAVSSAKLGQLAVGTGHLQAESVTGVKVAARTIGVNNLLVGSWENLAPNPGFEYGSGAIPAPWQDPTGGASGGNWERSSVDPRSGEFCMRYESNGQTARARLATTSGGSNAIECETGQPYHAEVLVRQVTGSVFPVPGIAILFRRADGSLLDSVEFFDTVVASAYRRIEVSAVAPAGAAKVMAECLADPVAGSNGILAFDDMYLRLMVQGSIIVDGAITADKIAANAVTADKIVAGAVTARKISVETLAAIVVDAGFLSAGRLQNAPNPDSTAGIRLSSNYTRPLTWTSWVDLAATGAQPFLRHPAFELRSNGDLIGRSTDAGGVGVWQFIDEGQIAGAFLSTYNVTANQTLFSIYGAHIAGEPSIGLFNLNLGQANEISRVVINADEFITPSFAFRNGRIFEDVDAEGRSTRMGVEPGRRITGSRGTAEPLTRLLQLLHDRGTITDETTE